MTLANFVLKSEYGNYYERIVLEKLWSMPVCHFSFFLIMAKRAKSIFYAERY